MALENIFETIAMMLKSWNKGNVEEVANYYANDAVLCDDDDGQVLRVEGKNEIKDYLTITFDLTETRGRPQMELHCKRMLVKKEYILNSGTYHWPNMHSGRFWNKWQYKSDRWLLVKHKFTIENLLEESQSNKENS